MRTTVTLDDDVYQAVSALSQVSGRPLSKVLSDVARQGLKPTPFKAAKGKKFPTFKLPPGAPLIPASLVQKIWEEEGLE